MKVRGSAEEFRIGTSRKQGIILPSRTSLEIWREMEVTAIATSLYGRIYSDYEE